MPTNNKQLPAWVRSNIAFGTRPEQLDTTTLNELKKRLSQFETNNPIISIVVPVCNEADSILAMLDSISRQQIEIPAELLIIENGSTDKTVNILNELNISYIHNDSKGISINRQVGLSLARGKYFLSCDADTLYPPHWAASLVQALQNEQVSCVYSEYSFLASRKRIPAYSVYEKVSAAFFKIRSRRYKFLNVMGFSFGFRTKDGLAMGGFNTKRDKWSDGWMAMLLESIGSIKLVNPGQLKVYTSDRRLKVHGSLWNAFVFRVKKEIVNLFQYLFNFTKAPYLKAGNI